MTATVLRADARCLPLPDASVDLIVTSPPYFGLRSYTDEGYCAECRIMREQGRDPRQAWPDYDAHWAEVHSPRPYDGQIGSEATPREWLAAMLECTAEWMRVLKPSGSIFVNLGDKYSTSMYRGNPMRMPNKAKDPAHRGPIEYVGGSAGGVPDKSLMGLPWRYALACMDDLGLILRRDIIWAKPNGLPESVTDRCRSSHEYLFHLVKQPRYYAAVDEIREAHTAAPSGNTRSAPNKGMLDNGAAGGRAGGYTRDGWIPGHPNPLGKLPGSVWEIPSQPLTVPAHLGVDHFAAFPMELPRRIILGWSPPGICVACGEGRRPVAGAVALDLSRSQARKADQLAKRAGLTEAHLQALLSVGVSDTGRGAATQNGTGKNTPEVYALAAVARAALGGYAREYLLRRPTGFSYACACPDATAPTRPAVVVDPFGGTGTTALVADMLGRDGVSFDLSADYCRLARWRTRDPAERARALGVPKPPPVPDGQGDLFAEVVL